MSRKYTIEEFYFYEKIINKLYWNLYNNLKIKNKNCKIIKNINKIKNINRSFINKIIIYNENNDKYYIIKKNNYIYIRDRELIMSYLINKKTYENKMLNKKIKIKKYNYYYPFDYPLPNVNICFYNKNKKQSLIKRIKLMYYNEDKDDYWYKLII